MADVSSSTSSRLRRRLLWSGGAVVLVAALILTPPLLNVSRLQRRIVANMSASLGRNVRMESVQLHLLPTPGFTLKYIVVNEDPAFGFEPAIRADEVDAQLRVSSLWRKQVEISRIRFVNPSVNLVRDASGHWNLESILIHAANIDAAPTSQKSASEQPRFPYIEATGARVNFKLGDEKLPFSLDNADFALWLPTAQQWRVRLVAHPLRTDANVPNAGTMRVEGALERAANMAQVPVDLKASWHNAPLGEASKLLTGTDANWRGTLHLDAHLTGLLGAGTLTTKLTVDELRRADFVPAQMLDVTTECSAQVNGPAMLLHHAACTVPDGEDSTPLVVKSDAVDFHHLAATPLELDDDSMPLPWVLNWMKLLSARVPAGASPDGAVKVHLQRDAQALWSGTAAVTLPAAAPAGQTPPVFTWNATRNPSATDDPACVNALMLAPTPAHLDATNTLSLSGSITACGYSLHASGTASAHALRNATIDVPMLTDALDDVVAPAADSAPVDIVCSSTWSGEQDCVQSRPAPVRAAARHRR
ncbi:AsmA family protein [Granulicella cerasi]|uniref:AsmA family protein n=1 Tax=Granulicella cerasi TaxID=741063 RepID=A0ABW1Z892_9BACT|nr:AsmA family protein [Granulicella cerasi]